MESIWFMNKKYIVRMQRGLACVCLCAAMALTATAQPWAKKAVQAVFTLKTFDANGSLLGSSCGFFIGPNGEAVSSYTPFRGASRAVVFDAQGKELAVRLLTGVNSTYDLARFQVDSKKTTPLTLADRPLQENATAWLLPYTVKNAPTCTRGTVSKTSQFRGDYTYYTLAMAGSEQQVGCPVLNESGEVVAMLQQSSPSATASTSYAVSARFACDLRIHGMSINDPDLKATLLPFDVPDNENEATLSLFLGATTMGREAFADYVGRYIGKYPKATDGYLYRARLLTDQGDFQGADENMQQAVSVAERKDEAYYQYAQLIYQKVVYQADRPYEPWTLQKALQLSQEAYRLNAQPIYRQQQAEILFAQEQYEAAYECYKELFQSPLRSAEVFYAAAQCKLQQGDKKSALALLDSTVSTFTRPYVKTAAPYLRARAQLEMKCRRYQQAVNDMQDAVQLEPNNAEYWAEKASNELRLNLTDEAIASAEACIRLLPQGSDGYLLLGAAQCVKGLKGEGLQNLRKAKELGNEQAQPLLDKYGS